MARDISITITWRSIVMLLLAAGFYVYELIMQVAPGVIAQNLLHDFAINATVLGAMSSCFTILILSFNCH